MHHGAILLYLNDPQQASGTVIALCYLYLR